MKFRPSSAPTTLAVALAMAMAAAAPLLLLLSSSSSSSSSAEASSPPFRWCAAAAAFSPPPPRTIGIGTPTVKSSSAHFGRPAAFHRSSSGDRRRRSVAAASSSSLSAAGRNLDALAADLNAALEACTPTYFKNARVKVAPSSPSSGSSMRRLGLVATEDIKANNVALSVPYDDQIVLTATLATGDGGVLSDVLPEGYDGWTGDRGLIALLVLNELAKASASSSGIDLPARKPEAKALMAAWVKSLPSPSEMSEDYDENGVGMCPHPLLWSEDSQELLQGSSTKKIYRTLDDIDEDGQWLDENVWSADRIKFPAEVTIDGEEGSRPCFSPEGFVWANAIVSSRSVFVDGALRLIPLLDMANHDDLGTEEVSGGTTGAFGTTKCAELRTSRKYAKGEEVLTSYGPLSAAEYLSEYGFVPPRAKSTAVSELTFEVDPSDRFYDDKLDVLEFETYDSAPMDPVQKFDVVYQVGRADGEPDPALMQFLRLVKLGDKDAFLLESIFRKDIWGFMSLPVSESNEGAAVDAVVEACRKALGEMDETESELAAGGEDAAQQSGDENEDDTSPAALCAAVREAERKALARTLEYMERERMALDLKEYYQERRLKDLGLDSEWNEDDENSDVGWGQTRAPGSGDLDW